MSTAAELLSDRERDVIEHALGLNRSGVSSRNHFAADADSDDDKLWLGLVEKGFATGPRTKRAIYPDLNFFYVTEEGRRALAAEKDTAP